MSSTLNRHPNKPPRPLVPGMYAPLPTFYLDNDEQDLGEFPEPHPVIRIARRWCSRTIFQCCGVIIDIPTLKKHVVFLANAGVGLVLAGTMGEGIHLSHSDRVTLVTAAREALDNAGFTDMPIIVGTGAGSTHETVQLSKEVAEAGADYVIVIIPGYFAGLLASNKEAVKTFFTEVAEKSPIPVIIYNCGFILGGCGPNQGAEDSILDPGATGGIDLDSDLILEIAEEAPNTVGVKLTYAEFTGDSQGFPGLTLIVHQVWKRWKVDEDLRDCF